MAQWPDFNWAQDVSAEHLEQEKKTTCFKAPEGKFLPILMDLYNGTAKVVGDPGPSLDVVRESVSKLLIGQIAMRAFVIDEKCIIRFEMDSRLLA